MNGRPRCTSTHWHEGEELRCIDVEDHTSAHYNVVWWPNDKGLPNRFRETKRLAWLIGWLIVTAAVIALTYWMVKL